jgi:hypothetical protein
LSFKQTTRRLFHSFCRLNESIYKQGNPHATKKKPIQEFARESQFKKRQIVRCNREEQETRDEK